MNAKQQFIKENMERMRINSETARGGHDVDGDREACEMAWYQIQLRDTKGKPFARLKVYYDYYIKSSR